MRLPPGGMHPPLEHRGGYGFAQRRISSGLSVQGSKLGGHETGAGTGLQDDGDMLAELVAGFARIQMDYSATA